MNRLNENILKGVKDNIAMFNFREEYRMKKVLMRQIFIFLVLGVIILSGSFFTVNAATNGKFVNNIKEIVLEKVKEIADCEIKEDSLKIEEYKVNENGDVITVEYSFEDINGGLYAVSELEKE